MEPLNPEQTAEEPQPNPPPSEADHFHGLAGDFVRLVEPFTEADPTALLLQFLTAFGSIIGRGPHCTVEATNHYTNLFTVCVGTTARSRKGTSWAWIRELFSPIDPTWAGKRIRSGLSSGEGLVLALQDSNYPEHTQSPTPASPPDRRLLILESEFGQPLSSMQRRGNILSAILRCAWDTGNLHILSRSAANATAAHISVIAHITVEELRRLLSRTDIANGFANRFLWLCVARSRLIADGGLPPSKSLEPIRTRLAETVALARTVGRVTRDPDAELGWRFMYESISRDLPGPVGHATSRTEAHALRLACIYALLDRSSKISSPHLRAALSLAETCRASAGAIFGQGTGDPVSNTILQKLRTHPETGLSRTEISRLFSYHIPSHRLSLALSELERSHGIVKQTTPTEGRPETTWYLPQSKTA